jgi:hypothetical protein
MNEEQQSLNIYIDHLGKEHFIKDMSKGYLKNQIEFITRTSINFEYLDILTEQLRIKSRKIFKLLKDE